MQLCSTYHVLGCYLRLLLLPAAHPTYPTYPPHYPLLLRRKTRGDLSWKGEQSTSRPTQLPKKKYVFKNNFIYKKCKRKLLFAFIKQCWCCKYSLKGKFIMIIIYQQHTRMLKLTLKRIFTADFQKNKGKF